MKLICLSVHRIQVWYQRLEQLQWPPRALAAIHSSWTRLRCTLCTVEVFPLIVPSFHYLPCQILWGLSKSVIFISLCPSPLWRPFPVLLVPRKHVTFVRDWGSCRFLLLKCFTCEVGLYRHAFDAATFSLERNRIVFAINFNCIFCIFQFKRFPHWVATKHLRGDMFITFSTITRNNSWVQKCSTPLGRERPEIALVVYFKDGVPLI